MPSFESSPYKPEGTFGRIVISMRGVFGLLLSVGAIAWSSYSAVRMLDAKLKLLDLYFLVLYPTGLLYSCFVLIAIL
jgi:hypothetical protein